MTAASGPSGLVYRDGSRLCPESTLADAVAVDLAAAAAAPAAQHAAAWARVFLSAATLETALADVGDADPAAGALTDAVADVYVGGGAVPAELRAAIERWRRPRPVRVSDPEGFAYYALLPLPFARAALAAVPGPGPLCVVGIRTIGTALAALTAAVARQGGRAAQRLTVRPEGHPYQRRLVLPGEARAWIARAEAKGADFLVVDEGPGLSGSSLLATGEALLEAGATPERICLFGTRAVDPAQLCTDRAVERWRRFRHGHAELDARWLHPGERDLSGGGWRALLYPDQRRYPAIWPGRERRKALAPDGRSLRRFVGLGRLGDAVHARAERLAGTGFTLAPLGPPDDQGSLVYPFVPGEPGRTLAACAAVTATLPDDVAGTLGRYIGARAAVCAVSDAGQVALDRQDEMLRVNLGLELGDAVAESALARVGPLRCERPIVCDGRLLPHEWIRTRDGRLFKTDAAEHGDDHFFPGAADVAWDVAGAIVEWGLGGAERGRLLDVYRGVSGDDVGGRLPAYLLAYAAFRARHCALAAHGSSGDERERLHAAQRMYNRRLRALVEG